MEDLFGSKGGVHNEINRQSRSHLTDLFCGSLMCLIRCNRFRYFGMSSAAFGFPVFGGVFEKQYCSSFLKTRIVVWIVVFEKLLFFEKHMRLD